MADDTTGPVISMSNPAGLFDPTPYAFSHVAEVRAGARLIFLAGQGGESADGHRSADFREQVRQAFANVRTAAESVGASLADVVKLTVLIVDHDESKVRILGEETRRAFGEAALKPPGTLIPVPKLALEGMLVEIDAILAVA